ncbi:hypothetical protein ACWCYY_40375 [Kitasatospora sp. NPDC001664]
MAVRGAIEEVGGAVEGRKPGIDRAAVKARMAAMQREHERLRTVEGLAEWWAKHFDTPFRLLGAVQKDEPEGLEELGPVVVEAARAVAAPVVMSERDPQRVVPFEEFWAVAGELAVIPGPGADVVLVFREGHAVVVLRLTGQQFRSAADVWLTPEAGLHVVLFADGTVLSLERDREYAPCEPLTDHVALWKGYPVAGA